MKHMLVLLSVASIAGLIQGACTARPQTPSAARASCLAASVEKLRADPGRYSRKPICLTGYLGPMVAYGEASARLFSTPEAARNTPSDYLAIGVPMTLLSQERLARYSSQKIEVRGIFHYDRKCWPKPGKAEADYQCFPPRPMEVRNARITFEDGTQMP
jgi:hypothetical protein